MADQKISQLTAATTPLAGTEVLPIVQSGSTVKVANNDLRPKQIQSNATSGVLQVVGPAAAATRVMTTPDANFTVARTDAAQTFTGAQTISVNGQANGIVINGDDNNNVKVRLANSGGGGEDFQIQVGQQGASNSQLVVRCNTTSKNIAFFNSSGDVAINNGNLIQGTAAKGVNFTANTPAAGMTSQLLNWYEEGTWTPNQGAGLTLVGAFSSAGTYTRIGRQVFISGSVSGATSVAVASAGAITTNLPYSAAADATGTAINAANNASSILRVSSATLTAATAIAATTTITFSAVYSV